MAMEIKIEVTSEEIIKPSSSPPHQTYHLSFIDQIAAPIFMPLIYFYHNPTSHAQSRLLKQSLSTTLSIFYPLAGRLVGDRHVNCNSAGVPYFEAQANCTIADVVANPLPETMYRFLPYEVHDCQDLGMAVQVTHFQCGGMAIGLLISHKIADASSFSMTANAWAAVARGQEADLITPKFEGAAIFPPRDLEGYKVGTDVVKRDQIVSKIFTFAASKISDLQKRYSSGERHATRIEALSAFIWSRFVSATGKKHEPNKRYTISHAVNLRNRVEPPLSECHFGNIIRLPIATVEAHDGGYDVVQKMRVAIQGFNVSGLTNGDDKLLNMVKERVINQGNTHELVSLGFSSWCRFPFYEADFGWGKPIWVGCAPLSHNNFVTFKDTPTAKGIEAWINLSKPDMDKFHLDFELQQFLSKVVV